MDEDCIENCIEDCIEDCIKDFNKVNLKKYYKFKRLRWWNLLEKAVTR